MCIRHIILAVLVSPLAAFSGTSTHYRIGPSAIDAGGLFSSSADYRSISSEAEGGSHNSSDYTQTSGTGYAAQLELTTAEIAVEQPAGTDLTDGASNASFGLINVGETVSLTFTIRNTEPTCNLLIGPVTFDGANAGEYSVTTGPASIIPGIGSTTFVVKFSPLASGTRVAAMHVTSNDASELSFDLALTGTVRPILGGTLPDATTPLITLPNGSFTATGLSFQMGLGFIPVPGETYTIINIESPLPDGIIGNFNDLPEGGAVALAFNGVIYYFQASYAGGAGGNDFTLTHFIPSAPPAWKWTAGPKARNGAGRFGTLNVPAATNNPGARQGAMNWRGVDGSLWMFGGYGYGVTISNPPRWLNDLWQYDRTLGRWIWRSGSTVHSAAGVHGVMGVESADSTPGARHTSTTWTDDQGHLWLFGGYGPNGVRLNDLWRYNTITGLWTWMKGASTAWQAGVYSGPPESLVPSGRHGATGWFTDDGSLWLFGGLTDSGYQHDLWRYSIATGNWSLMRGSSAANGNGIHTGPADTLTPGSRRDATGWVAQDGSLWLFAGLGLASAGPALGDLDDLWSFSPATNLWTWISGSSTHGAPGVYAAHGATGSPRSRSAGSGWTTVDGKFWLVGGFINANPALNDVWIYDPATRQWTWKLGSSQPSAIGVYGTLGVAAPANQPGARFTPSTWVTINGALWFFGGGGMDGLGSSGRLSDLWSYDIPAPPGAPVAPAPEPFPDSLIINAPPSSRSLSAQTMAYVPVSGQFTARDTDGDPVLFHRLPGMASHGGLEVQPAGTWTYTPASGFIGTEHFNFQASDSYGGMSPVHVLSVQVTVNPADSDNDRLPDSYEQTHWGNTEAGALDDADHDGQTNYFEYLAGTSPVHSSEHLDTLPSTTGSGFTLGISHTRPGVRYLLEGSVDLRSWHSIETFTFDTPGRVFIQCPGPPGARSHFFRISLGDTPAVYP